MIPEYKKLQMIIIAMKNLKKIAKILDKNKLIKLISLQK
jgi:hypothetical protein